MGSLSFIAVGQSWYYQILDPGTQHGTTFANGNFGYGTLFYTPNPGFTRGQDSLKFSVNHGQRWNSDYTVLENWIDYGSATYAVDTCY